MNCNRPDRLAGNPAVIDRSPNRDEARVQQTARASNNVTSMARPMHEAQLLYLDLRKYKFISHGKMLRHISYGET